MLTAIVAVAMLVAAGVDAQLPPGVRDNQCAVCHLRLVWTRSVTTHTDEWITSVHAIRGVGCDKCHGGDPSAIDSAAAHRGVARHVNPASAVHRTVLPETCAGCHPSQANAFRTSIHDELLREGDATAPTCTTCHTSMTADIPSAIDLQRRCNACHPSDRDDRAARSRRGYEHIIAMQNALRRAKIEIAAVTDEARRRTLDVRWAAADVAVRGGAMAIHAFDQSRLDDRIADARLQVDRLENALASR